MVVTKIKVMVSIQDREVLAVMKGHRMRRRCKKFPFLNFRSCTVVHLVMIH